MNVEKYFKEMYANIWQGHDLNKIDDYYENDFINRVWAVVTPYYPI